LVPAGLIRSGLPFSGLAPKAAAAIFLVDRQAMRRAGPPRKGASGRPVPGLSLVPHETCFRADETVLKQIRRTNMELE